jgi:hypothetical protein
VAWILDVVGCSSSLKRSTKVEILETMKISWFAQLERGYVWGHIFCRIRRRNDEDTLLFEDF